MINLHFVAHFIKHYLSATRIDVLHSPFVFSLYNTCIARQKQPVDLNEVEHLRNETFRNLTYVMQQDLGAGKPATDKRIKPIRFFAKYHAKPKRIAHIIYRMVKQYKYNTCIELGTSLGFTSLCIAKALTNTGTLITIEGAPEIAAIAQQHFNRLNVADKINLLEGNFDEALPKTLNKLASVDFAFIDGNHTYEATLSYFNQLLPKMHNHSVLIFDDIYWSKGMTKAWEHIKHHPDVTVTVDLFYIGLVYFRKEQVKQHFKLRVW